MNSFNCLLCLFNFILSFSPGGWGWVLMNGQNIHSLLYKILFVEQQKANLTVSEEGLSHQGAESKTFKIQMFQFRIK